MKVRDLDRKAIAEIIKIDPEWVVQYLNDNDSDVPEHILDVINKKHPTMLKASEDYKIITDNGDIKLMHDGAGAIFLSKGDTTFMMVFEGEELRITANGAKIISSIAGVPGFKLTSSY